MRTMGILASNSLASTGINSAISTHLKSTSVVPLAFSIQESIRHSAQYAPRQTAIANETQSITYQDLSYIILKFRSALKTRKLARQTAIGLLVTDKFHFIAALAAILAEEHKVIILDQKVSPEDIKETLEAHDAKSILCDKAFLPKLADLSTHISIVDTQRVLSNNIPNASATDKPKSIVQKDLNILSALRYHG